MSVTATPVISGGRAFVSASTSDPADPTKGGVIAIDLATGAQVWRNLTAAGFSSLALDAGVLYMHDAAGFVRALDVDDGHELWAHETDENPHLVGFSSPIVTKDFVLVGGSSLEEVMVPAGMSATFRGFVVALNKSEGSLAWKKYTVEPPSTGAAIWSTLSADEGAGVLIAATGNNYTGEPSDTSDAFLALPLADGTDFLWKQQILEGDVFTTRQSNGNPEADFGANPILFEIQGRKLAAGGNKGGDVWVVDRSDGSIVRQRNFGPRQLVEGRRFQQRRLGREQSVVRGQRSDQHRCRQRVRNGRRCRNAFCARPADPRRQVGTPGERAGLQPNHCGQRRWVLRKERDPPGLQHRHRRSVDGVSHRGHDLLGTCDLGRIRGVR